MGTDRDVGSAVTFGGIEGSLALRFARDPVGGVLARCDTVTITLGPLVAEIRTRPDLDVRRTRDEIAAVLAADDLSGAVDFGSVEHDLWVDVELRRGRGVIVVLVRSPFAGEDGRAEFRLTTDQTFLEATLGDLDALIEQIRIREARPVGPA